MLLKLCRHLNKSIVASILIEEHCKEDSSDCRRAELIVVIEKPFPTKMLSLPLGASGRRFTMSNENTVVINAYVAVYSIV